MDREALEHGLVRRLLDHIGNKTTDLADSVLELSSDIYSEQRHTDELNALFLDHPLVLCLSGALPEPNTYRTVDLAGTPVLLTRDADGKVHGFLNACRHRGVRLMDGCGVQRRFACPFHAWTYTNQGKLVKIPAEDAFGEVDKATKGLIELPVAEGYGLVVGRLRPGDAVDVDAYLGPGLIDEMAMMDFADWTPYTEPHVHKVEANWKVTLDTFRENYHFDYLHKSTLATYAIGGVLTFDPFGPHLRNASALKSITTLADVPEEEWGDVGGHFSYQYALFPNTSLTFDARHIELWQIVPTGAGTSEVLHTAYVKPGLPDEDVAKLVDMAPWICETVVDGEDFWVAGRTEPGARTGVLPHVLFGRNEPAPQHLHHGIDAAVQAYKAKR